MHFSVYFDCILNEKNGSYHIEIMISAAHMMGACYATKTFWKNVQFDASWWIFWSNFA